MGVTIKTLDEYEQYSIKALKFSESPTDDDIKNQRGTSENLHNDYEVKEGSYTKFIYPIEDLSNVKYLVIYLDVYSDLKYLSVLVSSYKKKESSLMKEIAYNKEYILDSETLSNYKGYFMFWFAIENNENAAINIKLHKDDTNDFMISLLGTIVNPSEMKDQSDAIETRVFMGPDSKTTDSDYIIYKYAYTKLKDTCKYVLINAISKEDYIYRYMSIIVSKDSNSNSGSSKLSGLNILGLFAFLVLLF